MPEVDALIRAYRHLHGFPRANEALQTLKKIASLVKPIMRARNWKIFELTEFFPNEGHLLAFLPFEEVVDTMLHELCHNVISPHNSSFHALWNQLRDELEALLQKGFTGQNFLSSGQRLGGGRMPQQEIRRLAREAAQQQQAVLARQGFSRRLGGEIQNGWNHVRAAVPPSARRHQEGRRMCSDKMTERQIIDLTQSAKDRSTMTAAEGEEANEAAIAQALWEMTQEDEKKALGKDYAAPSQENPMGSGGKLGMGDRWSCHVCTLVNPAAYLCCDACGSERSAGDKIPASNRASNSGGTPRPQSPSPTPRVPETVDLTASPSPPRPANKKRRRMEDRPAMKPTRRTMLPPTWRCVWCSKVMEQQWWTCTFASCMLIEQNDFMAPRASSCQRDWTEHAVSNQGTMPDAWVLSGCRAEATALAQPRTAALSAVT
ncbi:DNA damage response protein-like protein [Emericellopsis cladophorae]|uniref:DNA damage response protein-like protein n=1 Tax=Emericellopsis cladophorae TaxID=2686198 RepID=A0A9P9Y496_9HYPO|nr:DNA damage response protein-like protein [Emericellopsis cladophorae]KAI6783106.1 DNA damage response protein-like protein [Emericellopsis cladophorae]